MDVKAISGHLFPRHPGQGVQNNSNNYSTNGSCVSPTQQIASNLRRHTDHSERLLESHCSGIDEFKTIWDRSITSQNIEIVETDNRILHRNPVAQSTDLAMTNTCFSNGFHVIQIEWPVNQRDTHAVIGLALKEAPVHAAGYINLLGHTKSSLGWDINNNKLLFDQKTISDYPEQELQKTFTKAPENIRCILNMSRDKGVLGFETDGQYLGDAFTGLSGNQLHVAISTVWGHVEIGVQYMGGSEEYSPLSLLALGKQAVLRDIKYEDIQSLDVPETLKSYLTGKLPDISITKILTKQPEQ